MANATKEPQVLEKGPEKKTKTPTKEELFLAQEFDPARKYMFELADPALPRHHPVINVRTSRPEPHKPFKPYQNVVFTAQVIWNKQRRGVRYYDGCDSIFIDEQPKDKETMDQFIRQTQRRQFIDGTFGCYGDERMLLLFMLISCFNVDSEFRTKTADGVYRLVDAEKKATAEADKLDLIEKALEYAKDAPQQKMLIHADYLGIPMKDFDSDNDLTEKEIRIAYRLEASRNPKIFVESYGNKVLEMRYFIKKAVGQSLIDITSDPNNAKWTKSGRVITTISGLKSVDVIADRLLEFSQTEEGEEFKVQVLALFNE